MSQSSHHSHDALDINNTDKKHHSKHKKHHHHKEAIEKELFDTSLASDNDYKYTNKRLREFTESHEEELTESMMDSKQVISPEQDYHGKDSKEVNNTKQIDQTLVSDHSVDKFDPSKLCTKADIGSGDLSKQIHIGNLPFNLHPEDVYNYFRPFGEIMRIYIPQRTDGRLVGFSMCEYINSECVERAVTQGTIDLDGHLIRISRRQPSGTTAAPSSSPSSLPPKEASEPEHRATQVSSTPPYISDTNINSGNASANRRQIGATLFIGNLPFTQTGPSLQMFFDSYECDTICVRVTTDAKTGKSRGFGYVDFETRAAAEDAMKRLNGVTCQGRKLKLDWTESRKR